MKIQEFKNIIFEKAKNKGFEKYEIYYHYGKSFSVNVYKGEVEKFQNNLTAGLSFRGQINGVMGYVYTERIEEDIIDELLENAKQNLQIINEDEKEIIYKGDENYPNVDNYNEKINSVSVEDKIQIALKMEKAVLEYDQRIISCNRAVVANSENEIYIANSLGLELNKKVNYVFAYTNAIAEENGQTKTMGEMKVAFDFDDIDPIKIGQTAAKKSIDCLGAKSINSGKYKVVIQNEAFVDLFSVFVGNFFAEAVQKGFSLLKGKINQKIANDNITIVDEPLLKGGYGSTGFDSEGVASYDKVVVENGILKTFLYNLKSAEKDGVKSTGNGFRSSFKGSISTQTTNFYIKAGEKDFDLLLKDVDNGIIITEFSGLHSGANSISGDFSLACEGFYIRNGEKAEPIEQITAAGNFYSMMMNIQEVGSDLKFESNGIGSPSIVINEIDIAGL